MAKGNLLLGTAKNSVGDVVMYRREGAQISRVRVRTIKNPKTDAQSFQRAIMAPIAKFYSPLSVVLERSFEGLSKAKSHNKFNQVNANLARQNKWALPKGTGFCPLPYQLSEGTMPAVSYDGSGMLNINISNITEGIETIGAISAALIAAGYKKGDVITILAVTSDNTGDFPANYVPYTYQFEVNEEDTTTLATFFGARTTFNISAGKISISSVNGFEVEAGAVIVSRFDGSMWRRSKQFLHVNPGLMETIAPDAFVAAAIASYGQTAGDGNPLVYLDGDELTEGQ